MNALLLIINREYTSRVRTKAFILTTLITPFLFLLVLALPAYLSGINDTAIKTVYVLDHTGKYYDLFESNENYSFVRIDKNEQEKMDALLEISKDLSEFPMAATFFSEQQQPPRDLIRQINTVLTSAVKSEKVDKFTRAADIKPEIAVELQELMKADNLIKINTFRWQEDGGTSDTMGEMASMVGLLLTFSMFFFIMTYGSLVMQSVVEEKSNRIIEVIISSVKPFHLMMGKIIGVALTGLTQIFVWVVIAWLAVLGIGFFAGMPSIDADALANASQMTQNIPLTGTIEEIFSINWTQVIICFILYFIGGYFLFASLFAMFGSAANDSQEAQQLITPVMVILFIAFYTGFAAARNPEGDIAFWCSLIPFTSPIVMIVRTPFEIPLWELALSLSILVVTAFLMVQLAARIYRVGILMHGKKVNIKEIGKWLRY